MGHDGADLAEHLGVDGRRLPAQDQRHRHRKRGQIGRWQQREFVVRQRHHAHRACALQPPRQARARSPGGIGGTGAEDATGHQRRRQWAPENVHRPGDGPSDERSAT
jgi:hypothetical protein